MYKPTEAVVKALLEAHPDAAKAKNNVRSRGRAVLMRCAHASLAPQILASLAHMSCFVLPCTE